MRVPTAEHHVGLAPQLVAERQRHAERIAAVEHAAAAAIAEHRRLQHGGQRVTSSDASCAPPPQMIIGRFARAEPLGGLADRVVVDLRLRAPAAAAAAPPGPLLPQTSMAHSSAAGPGRPVAIARMRLGDQRAAPARACG